MLSRLRTLLASRHMRIYSYACAQSEQARREGGYSRSANYLTAARSFVAAVGDVRLADISAATVARYQRWLKAGGVSPNTISCYNRTLRAIYNKAVAGGLVRDAKPFAAVFTGRAQTTKRSVPEDCLRRLRRLDLAGSPQLELARDCFLFSFYAMGMPFVDVACLRKEQIAGGTLVYDRRKTGHNVRVPLIPDALHLIGKYGGNDRSPYVFPILTATAGPEAYDEYCTRLNAYNRALKRLARLAGVSTRLSSYSVRHSWASMAYKAGVPLHAISQALGHARPETTLIYIRELDDGLMRRENDRVQRLID